MSIGTSSHLFYRRPPSNTTDEMSSDVSHESNSSATSRQGKPVGTVSVHALSCGHFTLPEYQFVHPVSREARKSVPSLAFLVQHQNNSTGQTTRIVFDLGLRKDVERYAAPIQKHIETRQPLTTNPDVTRSLEMGGLRPADIDYVLYSHASLLITDYLHHS
jgi:hypothetical protein